MIDSIFLVFQHFFFFREEIQGSFGCGGGGDLQAHFPTQQSVWRSAPGGVSPEVAVLATLL